jgi:hypothetical protein
MPGMVFFAVFPTVMCDATFSFSASKKTVRFLIFSFAYLDDFSNFTNASIGEMSLLSGRHFRCETKWKTGNRQRNDMFQI